MRFKKITIILNSRHSNAPKLFKSMVVVLECLGKGEKAAKALLIKIKSFLKATIKGR